MADGNYLFTSESVSMGHPDKLADRISDGILDALFEQDPSSRVACETMVTTGIVLVAGEYDKNVITYEEASCLSVQILLYYGINSEPKKLAHLERFTYNTDDFSHLDLIAELEASKNVPLPQLFKG